MQLAVVGGLSRRALCLLLVVAAAAARAEEGASPDLLPTVGSIERLDPRFDPLVPGDAVIEVVASGFLWAEGPVWLEREQAILFSDIPRNRVMRFKDGEDSPVNGTSSTVFRPMSDS